MTIPIYSKFTFGTDNNQITFNDKSGDYIIKARKRLAQNRDMRQYDTNIPDAPGVSDYQTLPGLEYYVIEGTLYARTESALYRGKEALNKVSSPVISQEDPDSDNGYVPLKWTENVDKQLMLKPLYLEIAETRQSARKPSFRILCKIKYPFVQSQLVHTESIIPSTTAGVGIVIPSTGIPITTNGIVIGADSGTGSGNIINNGDYKAFPTFNITGPINKPRITNQTTGKYIEFNYNITGSANITIRNDGVSATASDGTDLLQYLTSGSDLLNFALEEGSNQLVLTAASMGTGVQVTVSFQDSWPL